ncbi:putative QA-SNARE protein [Diplonema papillatum]|nr:putative QA-SNARE protein [Diplonema papillatum]
MKWWKAKAPVDDDAVTILEIKVSTWKYHLETATRALRSLMRTQGDQEARERHQMEGELAYKEMLKAIESYERVSKTKAKMPEYQTELTRLARELKDAIALAGGRMPEVLRTGPGDPYPEQDCHTQGLRGGHDSPGEATPLISSPSIAPSNGPHKPRVQFARNPIRPYGDSEPPFGKEHDDEVVPWGAAPSARSDVAVDTLKKAIEIQKDGLKSLVISEQQLAQTDQVAAGISTELRLQEEEVEFIADDLDNLHCQIRQARKEVFAFLRARRRDRCFLCLFICVLLFIIVTLILKFVNPFDKGGSDSDPDLTPPPFSTPSPTTAAPP